MLKALCYHLGSLVLLSIIYYVLFCIPPFETSGDENLSKGTVVEVFESHDFREKQDGNALEKAKVSLERISSLFICPHNGLISSLSSKPSVSNPQQ
jgi:hypothetical protein